MLALTGASASAGVADAGGGSAGADCRLVGSHGCYRVACRHDDGPMLRATSQRADRDPDHLQPIVQHLAVAPQPGAVRAGGVEEHVDGGVWAARPEPTEEPRTVAVHRARCWYSLMTQPLTPAASMSLEEISFQIMDLAKNEAASASHLLWHAADAGRGSEGFHATSGSGVGLTEPAPGPRPSAAGAFDLHGGSTHGTAAASSAI